MNQSKMPQILLAGERPELLRVVAGVLGREGYSTQLAHDTETMRDAIEAADIVIYEHSDESHLTALNPRQFHYKGPILLMVEYDARNVADALEASRTMVKPIQLSDVRTALKRLLPDSQ